MQEQLTWLSCTTSKCPATRVRKTKTHPSRGKRQPPASTSALRTTTLNSSSAPRKVLSTSAVNLRQALSWRHSAGTRYRCRTWTGTRTTRTPSSPARLTSPWNCGTLTNRTQWWTSHLMDLLWMWDGVHSLLSSSQQSITLVTSNSSTSSKTKTNKCTRTTISTQSRVLKAGGNAKYT